MGLTPSILEAQKGEIGDEMEKESLFLLFFPGVRILDEIQVGKMFNRIWGQYVTQNGLTVETPSLFIKYEALSSQGGHSTFFSYDVYTFKELI